MHLVSPLQKAVYGEMQVNPLVTGPRSSPAQIKLPMAVPLSPLESTPSIAANQPMDTVKSILDMPFALNVLEADAMEPHVNVTPPQWE
jgi:hypothetical protein